MSADPVERLAGFGRRVRHLRQAQHLDAAEAAGLAGMTVEHLAAVELGEVEATLPEAYLVADALGVHLVNLLNDDT